MAAVDLARRSENDVECSLGPGPLAGSFLSSASRTPRPLVHHVQADQPLLRVVEGLGNGAEDVEAQ